MNVMFSSTKHLLKFYSCLDFLVFDCLSYPKFLNTDFYSSPPRCCVISFRFEVSISYHGNAFCVTSGFTCGLGLSGLGLFGDVRMGGHKSSAAG